MKSFARQEVMIAVKCNVHPWMRSYIGVVSHPFFAVTGDDGTFTIKGLPPGTYTIETGTKSTAPQEQSVTVGAKESKTVDFSSEGLKAEGPASIRPCSLPDMRDYIELTKPRITWLILMSTGIGYFFGLPGCRQAGGRS